MRPVKDNTGYGVSASSRSSVVTVHCTSQLIRGDSVVKALGSLLSMGVTGLQKSRGRMVAPNLKSQGEYNYCNTVHGWSGRQVS